MMNIAGGEHCRSNPSSEYCIIYHIHRTQSHIYSVLHYEYCGGRRVEEQSIYRNQLSALIWGISKAFTTSHLYILEYSPRTKTQSLSYFTQSLKLLKIKASNLSTACFRCQFFLSHVKAIDT